MTALFASSQSRRASATMVRETIAMNRNSVLDQPSPTDSDIKNKRDAFMRSEAPIISPLRYPGAKRRFGGYIAESLRINGLKPALFVEPFAGGASVALQMLASGAVERIALGEKDALVASFWKTVFWDADWLIEQIQQVPLTLETWDFFRSRSFSSHRQRALACLFLNRTSFSGILAQTAGPIGGRAQTSSYNLACRFNKKTIVDRIQQAAALADRVVFVLNKGWRATINAANRLSGTMGDTFFYVDPPFYTKADRLYRFHFQHKDHLALRNRLSALDQPWLLSYDVAEPILQMYKSNGFGAHHIELLYSVSVAGARGRASEIMITNLPSLPHQTRLWRTADEWRRARPSDSADVAKCAA